MKKIPGFIILFFFSISVIISGQPSTENQRPPLMDTYEFFKARHAVFSDLAQKVPDANKMTKLGKTTGYTLGTQKSWFSYNYTTEDYDKVAATCRSVNNNSYIFVEDALWNKKISQAQVDIIAEAFSQKTPANSSKGIYAIDVETFGTPPDFDRDPRIVILILDIKDGYTEGHSFVAGFFDPTNQYSNALLKQYNYPETSNEGEIYYLDADPLDLTKAWGLETGLATTAHEFQHMIHFNYNPNQETFINEGCSELASVLCGYPLRDQYDYNHETNHYLLDWRDGDEVLTDYARAARFMGYLWDQFGSSFIKKIVQNQYSGIAGVKDALKYYQPSLTFSKVLENWMVANLINDRTVNTAYGYSINGTENAYSFLFDSPNQPARTDTVQALGASYYTFKDAKSLSSLFSTRNSSLKIKAVKRGSSTVIEDVTPGVQYTIPEFGSAVSEVNFVLVNTSETSEIVYNFQSAGEITSVTDGGNEGNIIPEEYSLEQNYPNPFNPSTIIRYNLPEQSMVTLKVYNLIGQEVSTLVSELKPAGSYTINFDASGLTSGIYLYSLQAGEYSKTLKMTVVK